MNTHAKVSDQHSIEFEFEDIEIEEDGLIFGYFFGTAKLAVNDPQDGSFYVKHIVLKGERRSKYSVFRRPSILHLYRPSSEARTFTAHLFRKLETALYRDREANDRWMMELENA